MKKLLLTCSLLMLTGCVQPPTPNANTPITLTVYTYDSLSSDYGLLPKITNQFEQDNQVKLTIVSFPDTGAMVNQLLAEQSNPQADIVLGIDDTDLARYPELFQQPTAFDYGYVGFVYDTEAIQFNEPVSLEDLAENPEYKDKLILEQPGLSSPGTQFMLWSATVFGDDVTEFWKALDAQVLTVTPDWNTAYYSLFLNGEAPIVLSYLTSPAYHVDQESTNRYQTIPMADGYLKQTEYAAVVKNQALRIENKGTQAFLDYIVSEPVQNQIATTQWMFPASTTATLPAAYEQIITPTPEETLTLTDSAIAEQFDSWLQQWAGIFGQ